MYRSFSLIAALVLALFAANAAAQSPLGATFEKSALEIVGQSGRHAFTVELAVEPAQTSQGLMYRRAMKPDSGMLFDFGEPPRRASMWMKNTFLPLDMLFIKPDGVIESIAQRTVPQSLVAISSRGPVRGVLELNGGTVSRLGIKPGDRVEHPIFATAK